MITFEEIKRVNDDVTRIEIGKGDKVKQYACVPARVQAFRELCPTGTITTEIVSHEDGSIIIKATVMDEDGKVLGTGFAQEKKDSTFINKTSYVENCETSAVGRALGFLGIGSDDQIASAEEVANAINQQSGVGAVQKQLDEALKKMREMAFIYENISPDNWEKITNVYKVNSISEMSLAQLINYHGQVEALRKKHESEA